MPRPFPFVSLKAFLLACSLGLSACATVPSAPSGDTAVMDALLATHVSMRRDGDLQRALFQQRVRPGTDQANVVRIVQGIAQEVPDSWHKDGQPASRQFQLVNGVNVEVWEYRYYDKYLLLSFQNGVLTAMTETPGQTVF